MTTEESILANQDEESRSTITDLALEEGELEEGEIEGDSASAAGGGLEPVLHPLEHSWTLWFDNPSTKSKNTTWGSSIRPVYTFSTVEDFWGLYNNINHPTKLAIGSDLHCFKNKIEPKWEDPICANGGKWTINCSRGKSDTLWLYTLLAMIGEQFEYGDEICGAVVSVRGKQERVAIWTKNASNEAAQISIGRQWKEIVDYKETIAFVVHEDAMHEKVPKNRYTV
ncbi:eukaryotic translation initiation factor 4E-1-like [Carex rostrata]